MALRRSWVRFPPAPPIFLPDTQSSSEAFGNAMLVSAMFDELVALAGELLNTLKAEQMIYSSPSKSSELWLASQVRQRCLVHQVPIGL